MMKLIITAAVVFFLFRPVVFAFDDYGNGRVSRVIRVIDGDTFVCDIEGFPDIVGRNIHIRIAGIDTPEKRAPDLEIRIAALKAKKFTEKFLFSAKTIELKKIRRGTFFRLIAEVWADNKNLGDELLKQGLAEVYKKGRKK